MLRCDSWSTRKEQLCNSAIPTGRVRESTRSPQGVAQQDDRRGRDWATGIVEDPKVQARLLVDALAGKLHPSVLTVLLAYAYGKPRETANAEPMISMAEIEEARQSLEAKLEHITYSLESHPVEAPASQR